ncbi:hypothetical protein D9758_017108 [Tetrapyrgos nigripes]|uniref:Uncharacterized protein n=1 Tax=Tetrapyrgos nigripes TaxID=182062 RepID=A0A8H5C2B5_9AGAR|nr:hypothetical protein D9758_017108 [Tetrapyrgos nigripes]
MYDVMIQFCAMVRYLAETIIAPHRDSCPNPFGVSDLEKSVVRFEELLKELSYYYGTREYEMKARKTGLSVLGILSEFGTIFTSLNSIPRILVDILGGDHLWRAANPMYTISTRLTCVISGVNSAVRWSSMLLTVHEFADANSEWTYRIFFLVRNYRQVCISTGTRHRCSAQINQDRLLGKDQEKLKKG